VRQNNIFRLAYQSKVALSAEKNGGSVSGEERLRRGECEVHLTDSTFPQSLVSLPSVADTQALPGFFA